MRREKVQMVTRADSPRLLDVMTRHQLYLEGLKLGYTQEFIDMTELLRRDIRDAFLDVEYDELSLMTRRELELFIRRLRGLQQSRYSVYTKKLLEDIRAFMDAETTMNAEIMENTQEPDDTALAALAALLLLDRRDRLWITIINAPIPANGVLPEDLVSRFAATGLFNVETAVRRAWANKSSVRGTLSHIVGTSRLSFRDGLLHRSIPQADAMIAALVQHVSGIVQTATMRPYFDKYWWRSIIDDGTTDICRSRDGKIYVFGQGPIPPAHYRCRSHIEPYEGEEFVDDSFDNWIERQPDGVRDDLRAARSRPLTLSDFISKLGNILAG